MIESYSDGGIVAYFMKNFEQLRDYFKPYADTDCTWPQDPADLDIQSFVLFVTRALKAKVVRKETLDAEQELWLKKMQDKILPNIQRFCGARDSFVIRQITQSHDALTAIFATEA